MNLDIVWLESGSFMCGNKSDTIQKSASEPVI